MTVLNRPPVGNIHMLTVNSDPAAGGGTVAPIGSIAAMDDGTATWSKVGAADTAWVKTSGAPLVNQRWCSSVDGTATSTGSPHDPILGLQAAIDSFPAPTTAAEEAAERVIHVAGGAYAEHIVFPNYFARWVILGYGSVEIGTFAAPKNVSWVTAAATFGTAGQPSMSFTSAPRIPGSMFIWGNFSIGDGGVGQDTVIVFGNAYVYGTVTTPAMTGDVGMTAYETTFNGAFTLATCALNARSCYVVGAMAINNVMLAHNTNWAANLTVTATPAAGGIGTPKFVGCEIGGTFDGPAGTALFDQYTADNCAALGGSGCSVDDYTEGLGEAKTLRFTPFTSDAQDGDNLVGDGTKQTFVAKATIPASTVLRSDAEIEVWASVSVVDNNAADTLKVGLEVDGNVVALTTAVDVADGDIAVVSAKLRPHTLGAAGKISGAGVGVLGTPTADSEVSGSLIDAAGAIDWTSAVDVTCTSEWSAGHADNESEILDIGCKITIPA